MTDDGAFVGGREAKSTGTFKNTGSGFSPRGILEIIRRLKRAVGIFVFFLAKGAARPHKRTFNTEVCNRWTEVRNSISLWREYQRLTNIGAGLCSARFALGTVNDSPMMNSCDPVPDKRRTAWTCNRSYQEGGLRRSELDWDFKWNLTVRAAG